MIKKFTLLAFAASLAGCHLNPTHTASEPELLGNWHVEQVYNQPVAEFSPASLVFEADHQLRGNNSCNNFFGTYQQSGSELTLIQAGMTRKACVDTLMEQEARVQEALAKVHSARQSGDNLWLLDKTGAELLTLSRR